MSTNYTEYQRTAAFALGARRPAVDNSRTDIDYIKDRDLGLLSTDSVMTDFVIAGGMSLSCGSQAFIQHNKKMVIEDAESESDRKYGPVIGVNEYNTAGLFNINIASGIYGEEIVANNVLNWLNNNTFDYIIIGDITNLLENNDAWVYFNPLVKTIGMTKSADNDCIYEGPLSMTATSRRPYKLFANIE